MIKENQLDVQKRPGKQRESGERQKYIESVRADIVERLRRLEEDEQSRTRRWNIQPIDYLTPRAKILGLPPDTQDISVIYDTLFEAGVMPGVIQTMKTELKMPVPPGSSNLDAYIQERFFGTRVVQDSGLQCHKQGQEWLNEVITSQRIPIDLRVAHRVQMLGNSVSPRQGAQASNFVYGADAAAITRLMFMCGGNEPDGDAKKRAHHYDPVDKLAQVIEARHREAPAREVIPKNNFFERMRDFIAVYADITHLVKKETRSDQKREEIDRRSRRLLSRVIHADKFQVAYWDTRDGPPDPFSVFQEMLLESTENNPWITEDCSNTPFDIEKFGLLITQDAPRGLVAEAVVGLNNYPSEMRSLRARNLAPLLASGEPVNPHAEPRSKEDEAYKKALSKFHGQLGQASGLISEHFKSVPKDVKRPETFEEKLKALEDIGSKGTWRSKEKLDAANHLHPFAALLRIVDPKKVFSNERLQQEFKDLFAELGTPHAVEEEATLAVSVQNVLDSERYDPYLDLPLLGTDSKLPLSHLLIDYSLANFKEKIIREGPYALLDPSVPQKALFAPPALREYGATRLEQAKQNFDSAAGIYPIFSRRALVQAGEAWNRLPDRYHEIVDFTKDQTRGYYGIDDNYSVAFYRSATGAIGDFAGKLMNLQGKRVMISNQEFKGVTKELQNHGARITGQEVVYLNDRDDRRSLTAEEVFAQVQRNIEVSGEPAMFLLSSQTRFGDAPFSTAGTQSHIEGIRTFTQLMKKAYPNVLLLGDDAQSFGRNDIGENDLEKLGFDALVNSGVKAGVEHFATLILRTKYPHNAKCWLDSLPEEKREDPMSYLQPGLGTESAAVIAAGGLLVQELRGRVDPWTLQRVPEGSSVREVAAERERRLTNYFLKQAAEYHHQLLDELQTNPSIKKMEISSAERDSEAAKQQFGCNVVYPVHRRAENYNGIVTVSFPNIEKRETVIKKSKEHTVLHTGRFVAERLAKNGIPVLPCLIDEHAIRVSFHQVHDFDAIDKFFELMKDIHFEYLREQVNQKNIQTFAALRETPNVPPDWMEN